MLLMIEIPLVLVSVEELKRVRRRRHLDNDFAKIVSYPDGEDDTPGYELMHD
jgi:hypothetical protein